MVLLDVEDVYLAAFPFWRASTDLDSGLFLFSIFERESVFRLVDQCRQDRSSWIPLCIPQLHG
jgi:hypothetical protein